DCVHRDLSGGETSRDCRVVTMGTTSSHPTATEPSAARATLCGLPGATHSAVSRFTEQLASIAIGLAPSGAIHLDPGRRTAGAVDAGAVFGEHAFEAALIAFG